VESPPATLLDALKRAHRRGARVASICTGAFILAAAGLRDGRRRASYTRRTCLYRSWKDAKMNSDASSCHLSPDQWLTRDRAFVEELQLIGRPATSRSVEGRAGLVTTTSCPIAAYAGINVLRAGGTAADAAATIALTQATTALGSYVSHAGVVQALYYEADSGKIQALNARWNTYRHETDPKSIPACDLSIGGVGLGVGFGEPPAATAHGRKTLVPGFMAGIEALHKRFGRLAFSDLFVPAIWYAENGLSVGPGLAWCFETRGRHLARTPEGQEFMRQSGRERPQAGDRFVQAELAKTLRAVAKEGARYMYGGAWGRLFVDMVQREGGKATIEDMESYEAIWEEPLETVFLDHRVVVAGPSSLGGRQVLQALNLIEQLALHRMGPYWQDERAFRDLSRVLGFVVSQDRPEVIDALTRTSDYSTEWRRLLLSSGRRDKRRHWNAQRIHKAGRVIRQFDLAFQLLAKRPDQARSKALSGRCTD
jgi:putative intracellular protease/amidase